MIDEVFTNDWQNYYNYSICANRNYFFCLILAYLKKK